MPDLMGRGINRLSAKTVASAKLPAGASVVRLLDGGGLCLVLRQRGAEIERRWAFRWKRGPRGSAKVHEMSLGPARDVTLAEARELAQQARALLAKGSDPRALKTGAGAQNFGQYADAYIEAIAPGFRNSKHLAQWRMTLGDTYCRSLRRRPINDVRTEDVLAVLQPVWQAKPETASRIQGRICRVLDAAKAAGLREGENPARWAGHLKMLLPARQKLTRGHHRAVEWADVPGIIASLRAMSSVSARALEWTILTVARTGEAIGAEWSELEGDVWTVPAARMKMKRAHRVPLSERCVEIAAELRATGSPWLFPSKWRSKHISNMAMLELLKDMQVASTVHGFRACFKTWAEESTSFPREIIEASLAHLVGNSAERAYRRGDALDRRRELMAAWGRFCASACTTSNVVALRA
jgi:integrase